MTARRAAFVAAAIAATLVARASAHDPITTKVTWSKEISTIVGERCAGCHRPDGPAPMPLLTYAQARPWAKAMRAQAIAGRMPRWNAARGIGHFANDRGLSPFEITLLAAWADGGAPEGDNESPALALPEPDLPDTWLDLPARTEVPAGDEVQFTIDAGAPDRRWMTGWRFEPRDPAIVQAEFSLADGTYLGSWVPPETTVRLPATSGVPLPADATIAVTVWYRRTEIQEDFPVGLPFEAPSLGLFVTRSAPVVERRTAEVACGRRPVDWSGEVSAVRPLVAAVGSTVAVAVMPADGPPLPLLYARDFDPRHLTTYRLQGRVRVETGTELLVESASPDCRVLIEFLD